jgi:hypothetical protein
MRPVIYDGSVSGQARDTLEWFHRHNASLCSALQAGHLWLKSSAVGERSPDAGTRKQSGDTCNFTIITMGSWYFAKKIISNNHLLSTLWNYDNLTYKLKRKSGLIICVFVSHIVIFMVPIKCY